MRLRVVSRNEAKCKENYDESFTTDGFTLAASLTWMPSLAFSQRGPGWVDRLELNTQQKEQ